MESPLQQLEETIKSELINFGAKVVGITGANALNGPELTAIITAAKAYVLAIVGEDDLQEKGGPLFKNARNELRSELRREIEGKDKHDPV